MKTNNFYVRIYKSQTIIPPSTYFRPVLDHAPDAGFMIHVLLYIYIYTLVLIHKSKQAAPPLMTLPRPSYTPCSARLPSHVKQGLYLYSIFRLVFFAPYESVAPGRLALHVVKRIGGAGGLRRLAPDNPVYVPTLVHPTYHIFSPCIACFCLKIQRTAGQ